jgi:hypothetical protein
MNNSIVMIIELFWGEQKERKRKKGIKEYSIY